MSLLNHNRFRQSTFKEPSHISTKLEYILATLQEYGKVSVSFIQMVGKQDEILNSGVGKNLMIKLLALNMVSKHKINRTRCIYDITHDGIKYLECVKHYYNN